MESHRGVNQPFRLVGQVKLLSIRLAVIGNRWPFATEYWNATLSQIMLYYHVYLEVHNIEIEDEVKPLNRDELLALVNGARPTLGVTYGGA